MRFKKAPLRSTGKMEGTEATTKNKTQFSSSASFRNSRGSQKEPEESKIALRQSNSFINIKEEREEVREMEVEATSVRLLVYE